MVTTILFGLYTAGVAIVITLISYFTGMDKSGAASWINYLVWPFMILFLWLAMKERKRDDFDGTISYGQCVGTGALTGLWAGIATGIFMYVYFTAINPGMVGVMIDKQQAALQAQQIGSGKDCEGDDLGAANVRSFRRRRCHHRRCVFRDAVCARRRYFCAVERGAGSD